MAYLWHLGILAVLAIILAESLNLLVGFTGLVSLGHAAFYGLGAYTTALLTLKAGWGFLPAMGAAMLVCGLASLFVALPTLRLRGDYFVLATIGFQAIVYSLLYNWTSLTGGPFGLSDIPSPRILGRTFAASDRARYFVLCATAAVLVVGFLRVLTGSPYGRLLRAVREDDIAVASLGKDPARAKVAAFALSASLAAVPGALFVGYQRYVDPLSFTLGDSILLITMVVLGGSGNLVGPSLGAVLVVVLPEALRFLAVPEAVAANLRQVIFGALLIVLMRFRPRGLAGEYTFD